MGEIRRLFQEQQPQSNTFDLDEAISTQGTDYEMPRGNDSSVESMPAATVQQNQLNSSRKIRLPKEYTDYAQWKCDIRCALKSNG